MKKIMTVFLGIILLCCVAGGANAAAIIDQACTETTNTTFNTNASTINWQQEVVVGAEGILSMVGLNVAGIGSLEFYINKGSGWQTDADDYVSTVTFDVTRWNYIDVSAANLYFDVGDVFVIGIRGIDGGSSLVGGNGNPYTPGGLYINGALHADGFYDLNFRTYVGVDATPTPTPTPEPATLLLLGLGFAGLACTRRKRR